MATIQEAMQKAAALIAQTENGVIDAHTFENDVAAMLKEPLAARGFMAALATNPLPADGEILNAAINAIKGSRETTYILIIKNIVMATCAANEHLKSGHDHNAAQSSATAANSVLLATRINDPELNAMARELLTAISHWPARTDNSGQTITPQTIWYDFFERWQYSKESLLLAVNSLSTVAEQS